MPQHAIEVEQRGMILRGSVYRPDEPSPRNVRHPAVLFLHGFTGQRTEAGFLFVRLARALVQRGMVAVAFDFLHSGESDGSFEQMLVSGELADTLRMHQWLRGQVYVDRSRIGLLGFSLGGLLAACASARLAELRALVLLAPTTVHNLCRWSGDRDACAPAGPVTVGPHTLHERFFDDLRTFDPLADVARHPRPTLLVQGTGDTAVPPAVSQAYVERLRQQRVPLTVELIEGADHAFSKGPWQARLIEVVSQWTAAALGALPAGPGR